MKRFTDLTKDEVKRIVTDIFAAKKITNIKYHKREDSISCLMYTEWGSEDDEDGILTIADELILSNPFDNGLDAIDVHDISVNSKDYRKLEQFCFAKGIYGTDWIKDNPYLTNHDDSKG